MKGCDVCGRGYVTGIQSCYSEKKTIRKFNINIQKKKIVINKSTMDGLLGKNKTLREAIQPDRKIENSNLNNNFLLSVNICSKCLKWINMRMSLSK